MKTDCCIFTCGLCSILVVFHLLMYCLSLLLLLLLILWHSTYNQPRSSILLARFWNQWNSVFWDQTWDHIDTPGQSHYTVFSTLSWDALSKSVSLCVDNNPLWVCCQSFPEMFVFMCLLTAIWHSISPVVKRTNEPWCFLCFTRQLCKAVSSQVFMFSEYLTMFVLHLTSVSCCQGTHHQDFPEKMLIVIPLMLHHLPIV